MRIVKAKKDWIRRHYIKGQLNMPHMAEYLSLHPSTIRFYLKQFEAIEKHYPDKLTDYDFFISKERATVINPQYETFTNLMEAIVLQEEGPLLVAANLYKQYCENCTEPVARPTFYTYFRTWFDGNRQRLTEQKLKEKYSPDELRTLRQWRKGNDRRLWQVAVTLMTAYTYNSFWQLAAQLETTHKTLLSWLRLYKDKGLPALDRPGNTRRISGEKKAAIKAKIDNLVHLVRQSPQTYGIDRQSWFLTDLAYVFSKEYEPITLSTVSLYLKRAGVRYKRSREVLVSTDPAFREKYEEIQAILCNLKENEKFFSIDELGPKSIRPKGGRQLVVRGERPVYRKVDKGKGYFICTCALEMSTNQLTWLYSRKKDTDEIIKLIEVLLNTYADQQTLYLSWDAASWHGSQQLHDYVSGINDKTYRKRHQTPAIVLAPLPSRSPHLNVIESVFSGLAKSVLHNSDYDSVTECTDAIDRYFEKRNQYYRDNPKRAGNKIWGKEKVPPVFDKANICRNIG